MSVKVQEAIDKREAAREKPVTKKTAKKSTAKKVEG